MSRRQPSLVAWASRRIRILRHLRSDERGATTVMVAVLSVMMLGMLGFVVDYGVVEAKRSQLQIAADAAALAIAKDCSSGSSTECRSTGAGLSLATLNDADAASAVLNTGTRRVTVTTTASVDFSLMHTFGLIGADLNEVATAEWTTATSGGGTVTRANVYPFVLEACQRPASLPSSSITFDRTDRSACSWNLFNWTREAVYVGASLNCGKVIAEVGDRVRADTPSVVGCSVPPSPVIVALWDDPRGFLFWNDYRVSEFAQFQITAATSSAVTGRFVAWNPSHPDIVAVTGGATVPGAAKLIG